MSSRSFPSYFLPRFQNESPCKTFHVKMSLICMAIKMLVELISFEWIRIKTLFGTETNGNSEIAD